MRCVGAIRPKIALDQPIRNSRRVSFFAGYAWLFGAFMIVIMALTASRSNGSLLEALAAVAFGLAVGLPALWYGTRIRRAELRISAAGSVVVRNPLRSVIAPLDQVDAFQSGNATPGGKNPTPGIVLLLKDGRELPVWALAEESTIFSAKRKTASFSPLADDLNALVASARAARP